MDDISSTTCKARIHNQVNISVVVEIDGPKGACRAERQRSDGGVGHERSVSLSLKDENAVRPIDGQVQLSVLIKICNCEMRTQHTARRNGFDCRKRAVSFSQKELQSHGTVAVVNVSDNDVCDFVAIEVARPKRDRHI